VCFVRGLVISFFFLRVFLLFALECWNAAAAAAVADADALCLQPHLPADHCGALQLVISLVVASSERIFVTA